MPQGIYRPEFGVGDREFARWGMTLNCEIFQKTSDIQQYVKHEVIEVAGHRIQFSLVSFERIPIQHCDKTPITLVTYLRRQGVSIDTVFLT
jgi:hypothetical protein